MRHCFGRAKSTNRLLDNRPLVTHDPAMDIGLGLWTMRSTAEHPGAPPAMYAQLADDARLAEALGYHSVWIAEHHFWYDGWCPRPLTAAALALSATTTLHVGTGIHLLPLADAGQAAREIAWLQKLSGGRFEHGVGLGYRASEYDGFGLSRKHRGRRMDAALDSLAAEGAIGRTWVGGFADVALRRAATRGLGVMIPSTLSMRQLRETIDRIREQAAEADATVSIGVMKYTCPTDGTAAGQARAAASLDAWTREYTGSWFPLKGRPGFASPDLLDQQLARSTSTALFGTPEAISEDLHELRDAGVELCVLHLVGDGRLPEQRERMEALATEVLPGRTEVAA